MILESSTKSTRAQYETYLKKWTQFCQSNNISKWNPNINHVLNFLTYLFSLGNSYTTVNTARSALSLVLNPIDNFSIGSHPLVCRLLKAISKKKPPRPRYSVTWNVDRVLNIFRGWPITSELNIKQLSLKLVGLLALTTAQRVQTLHSILVSNIIFTDVVTIRITSILKTSRPGVPEKPIVLNFYNIDEKLCVAKTLRQYLDYTQSYRKSDNLFLSLESPFKPVTRQTLSRWLSNVLELAGVGSEFRAHSFRHASTSKVAHSGVNVDSILSHVGWRANSSVFARFYNRPVLPDNNEVFSNAVLG